MRAVVVRTDNDGDVLLAGPAVRAVARRASVTMLVAPSGLAAARLLPGVDDVLAHPCPWSGYAPPPVDPAGTAALVAALRACRADVALVLTSFHQSPLPAALLLRLAGVPWVGAVSTDYPGSLLDLRLRPEDLPDGHEAQRMLAVAVAAGFPAGPDGDRLAVRRPLPPLPPPVAALAASPGGYVVVHPGASVPARAPRPQDAAAYVAALTDAGRRVVVTGAPGETALTAAVSGGDGLDLGGRTDLAGLAAVLAGAACVVVGNTGPAHLAAAVGTPVVSLFAPVVDPRRWAPHGVPLVVLGDQEAPCAGTRARQCPVPGHPCLSRVGPGDVVQAVAALTGPRPADPAGPLLLAEVTP